MMSDTTHEGQNGTLECIRGSHLLPAASAQVPTVFSGAGREAQWPINRNPRNGPPEQDHGTDPELYTKDHLVHKAPAGTIVAFQNGMWHRALPNMTDKPRTIVYFQSGPPNISADLVLLLFLLSTTCPGRQVLPVHDPPAAPRQPLPWRPRAAEPGGAAVAGTCTASPQHTSSLTDS